MLSGILVVNTLFPTFDIVLLLPWLGAALGAMFLGVVAAVLLSRGGGVEHEARQTRATWRMPQLTLLDRPVWSRGRLVGMYALRGYLVVAVLLLAVKAVELGLGR
jgi:hypothetical protein